MNPEAEGVLVISCCILPAEDIVLQIIGAKELPEPLQCLGDIKGFLWSFENKYYTAQVNLFALEEKSPLDPMLLSSIRAVVFCYNPQKQSSFQEVLSWMPFLKEVEADVQIILANNCSEECNVPDLDKKNVLDWCVQNQFELVQLSASSDSDDEESDFKDSKGYDRVIEALQTHSWSNMVMKPTSVERNQNKESLKIDSLAGSATDNQKCGVLNTSEASNENCTVTKSDENSAGKLSSEDELLEEEKWLDGVLNGEDPGGESFEALFARFASLKEKSSGLSGEERKKYAEKVAIAFWRAMGGDEDELEGLDEDET